MRTVMRIRLPAVLVIVICAAAIGAEIRVKYLSSENVYIDAGSADSLAIGDTLTINRGDSLQAELEVIFIAVHSASCKVIKSTAPFKIGTVVCPKARVEPSQPAMRTPAPDLSSARAPAYPRPSASQKPAQTHVRGSISLQAYYWNDINPSNLDFAQPATRLNLQALKLGGSDFSFKLRSTSRYDRRSRSYNSNVPRSEWRNRFYQLSFGYYSDRSPYGFEVGRIISNRISGIGYIDGLLAQARISPRFIFGAFGGTQPQWQYSSFQTSLQKYGVYGGYSIGEWGQTRYELTIAAAGEYHGRTVSREFAYIQNNIVITSNWSVFQSGELDFNRGWRRDKTGKSLSLTNFYLSTRRRFTNWLSAGLSLDSRKNYWTYEIRSLADSLFDDNLQRAARADISIRLPGNYLVSTSFGIYKRTVDAQATYSYSAGIDKANFLAPGLFGNVLFSGFSNLFTDGYNITARLGRYVHKGDMIGVAYSAYHYIVRASSLRRHNQSIQFNSQINLIAPAFLSALYEYDTGDDMKGHRLLGELGYRF